MAARGNSCPAAGIRFGERSSFCGASARSMLMKLLLNLVQPFVQSKTSLVHWPESVPLTYCVSVIELVPSSMQCKPGHPTTTQPRLMRQN